MKQGQHRGKDREEVWPARRRPCLSLLGCCDDFMRNDTHCAYAPSLFHWSCFFRCCQVPVIMYPYVS